MRQADVALLIGRAAGRCSHPDCGIYCLPSYEASGPVIIGEMAHVIARRPGGPRGKTCAENNRYENLIFLCPNHHTIVDRAEADFPPELLQRWKAEHEKRVQSALEVPPLIWRVPHRRNPNFTDREDVLQNLDRLFDESPLQFLHGLFGTGKSQIAVEYLHRYAMESRIVWWISSDEPSRLGADYVALADALELPRVDPSSQPEATEALKSWLRENTSWILVFDNAPDPESVAEYLPPESDGKILVTSVNPNWRALGTPTRVGTLDRKFSVLLLQRRSTDTSADAGNALAEELGDFPLALEQAGAYIEASGSTFDGYLRLFQERTKELLAAMPPPIDYPHSITTTWELSFQRIRATAPAAAVLLNLCSFLSPEDIPIEMLRVASDRLPNALSEAINDPLALNRILETVRRYSLMEVSGDSLSMHRLVQVVARNRLSGPETIEYSRAALEVVDAVLE